MAAAEPVYLDHNATTPLSGGARSAMRAAMDLTGNPSSVHRFGRTARAVVEGARRTVADLVGADPSQVVFTSGATEANAIALAGAAAGERPIGRRLVSAVEHDSVVGWPGVEVIPVDRRGVADLDALAAMLASAPGPALVSVMAANNETGVLQPVEAVASLARRHGALLHVDAVQAAGKIPVDMAAWDADVLTLSAHKLGGPKGTGALILRDGVTVRPLWTGGGQERRRRAGTENIVGIAGFGGAVAEIRSRQGEWARVAGLRDGLEAAVAQARPEAVLAGSGWPRLANTASIALAGVPSETQVMALDLEGVAVSAGSACSSGKVTPSHVLAAMGLPPEVAGSTLRVSLGLDTTEAECRRFVEAWRGLERRLSARAA